MRAGCSRRCHLVLGGLCVVPAILVLALPMGFSHRGRLTALPAAEVVDYLTRPGRLHPPSPLFIAKDLGGDIAVSLEGGRSLSSLSLGSSSRGGRFTDGHPLTND